MKKILISLCFGLSSAMAAAQYENPDLQKFMARYKNQLGDVYGEVKCEDGNTITMFDRDNDKMMRLEGGSTPEMIDVIYPIYWRGGLGNPPTLNAFQNKDCQCKRLITNRLTLENFELKGGKLSGKITWGKLKYKGTLYLEGT